MPLFGKNKTTVRREYNQQETENGSATVDILSVGGKY